MFANLFEPINIGKLEVRNRIVLAPMGIGSYNPDETVTDDYVDFIKARTKNTGLIITSGARASAKYGKLKFLGCYSNTQIPGLQKLTSAAHKNDAKIFAQILVLGGADISEPFVPSAGLPEFSSEWMGEVKPMELNTGQIKEIIDDFGKSAHIAQEAGFDGVELDCAENFMLSDFMCPHFNKRADEYGGNFENRMRFPVEVIRSIKQKCGIDFPVGVKYNAFYDIEDGINMELGARIAKKLQDSDAAYIHEWSFAKLDKPMSMFKYPPMPNLYQPRNSTIPLSSNLKTVIKNIPVIAACGILKPDEADKIIESNQADMVAVGRAFIAENLWASKSKDSVRIRPCIRCHVCHHEVAVLGKSIVCSVNPDVLEKYGNFYENSCELAKKVKKVAVVGAGPGGITAALTASRRGHQVTLFEKEDYMGGKLIPGSSPDFKYEFKDLLKYLRQEVYESKIKALTGIEVTAGSLKDKQFEVLLIAIGAEPFIPNIKGSDNNNVITAEKALNNPGIYNNRKIVVLGGGDVGCETALLLSRRGNDVIIVEILDEIMKEEDIKYNSVVLEKMLKEDGVKILTSSKIVGISKESVSISRKIENNNNNISEFTANLVVIAAGYKQPSEKVKLLESTCRSAGIDSYVIGDCLQPRRLRNAIEEGFKVGMQI
ncbi:MAG: NAD(P)/FAD-dependent oxidoreductase [Actinobacteria bacterium]|nr:NAD(P)/FAD-dependent oxidoreductase [Actinomycetota bacterium]